MAYSIPIRDANGNVIGIGCGRAPRGGRPPLCSVCRKRSGTQLCDGEKRDDTGQLVRGKTCDTPICTSCSYRPPSTRDRDLCPKCRPPEAPTP